MIYLFKIFLEWVINYPKSCLAIDSIVTFIVVVLLCISAGYYIHDSNINQKIERLFFKIGCVVYKTIERYKKRSLLKKKNEV